MGSRAGVVAVSATLRLAPGRRHGHVAGRAAQKAAQQRSAPAARSTGSALAIGQQRLHAVEGLGVDDGLVLAVVQLAVEMDLADVEVVRQEAPESIRGENGTSSLAAITGRPSLQRPAPAGEFPHYVEKRGLLQVEAEDFPDLLGLALVHHEAATLRRSVVSEDRHAARESATAPGGVNLVPCAFGDELALVLG